MAGSSSTLRVSVLGAALAGVLVAPGAAFADGPGYGGNANALIVQWRLQIGTRAGGLAVYAVGFRAGSQVHIRVGAAPERIVITDNCGALRVIVVRGTLPLPSSPTSKSPTPTVPASKGPTSKSPTPTVPASKGPTSKSPTGTVPTPKGPTPKGSTPKGPTPTTPPPRVIPSRTAASRSVVANAFTLRSHARPAAAFPVVAFPVVALPALARPVAAEPTDTTVLTVADESISRLSPGTSVLVVGETPTGAVRTLVGAVPPPEAGRGVQDLVPWMAAAALMGAALLWTRRRSAVAVGLVRRYRRPARHRA